MKLEITKHEGRWIVNGEYPKDLSPSESKMLEALIVGARLENLGIQDDAPKPLPDWDKLLNDK